MRREYSQYIERSIEQGTGIATQQTLVAESVPSRNATVLQHEQSRVINIIGRYLTSRYPQKSFVVSLTPTLDGVKYRFAFYRSPFGAGLTSQEERELENDIRHDTSMYISKKFGHVYHLEYGV